MLDFKKTKSHEPPADIFCRKDITGPLHKYLCNSREKNSNNFAYKTSYFHYIRNNRHIWTDTMHRGLIQCI